LQEIDKNDYAEKRARQILPLGSNYVQRPIDVKNIKAVLAYSAYLSCAISMSQVRA